MNFWDRCRNKLKKLNRTENPSPEKEVKVLEKKLEENLIKIKDELGDSSDLVIRYFELGTESPAAAAVVYISGLVDDKKANKFIEESLKVEDPLKEAAYSQKDMFDIVRDRALSINNIVMVSDWNKLLLTILNGETVILLDGYNEAITANTKGGQTREITEPSTQLVIRGPKVAFTESIGTNVALIRRYIKSPNLRVETQQVGSITKTDTALVYIKGTVNEKVLREVKKRLNKIEVEDIIESGNIEEYIQDNAFTPFPTIYNSERPDAVVGNLLEGRIAVIVDGTPFVLVVPALFIQFFQSPSDYYQNYLIGSFLRMLRIISYIISILTPSLYIALTTFHPQMIPTSLLISLAAQHEGVPFPVIVEVLIMEFTFEIIREAGLRMPRAVGQAVSIVGALVLGQAAVQAGIVSPTTIIVVAFTGIASFATPSYNIAVAPRLLRFLMMILAGGFGLYGVFVALFILIAHLTSLRSFGIPYLSPFAPFIPADFKDTIIRRPLWSLDSRPRLVSQQNNKRQARGNKPSPSDNHNGN
ncbi:spore germination protein [Halobacillus sp. A5]|uniref:spore germination protein n=1 Tax=Halobacillus sp. A5 TaxID=2880263 RepID=UPI0020A68422|nr:spore germination protein [Halobacillus sp. A5]MCP3026583.1 spore germination protein [Halobacillus sp. A5]